MRPRFSGAPRRPSSTGRETEGRELTSPPVVRPLTPPPVVRPSFIQRTALAISTSTLGGLRSLSCITMRSKTRQDSVSGESGNGTASSATTSSARTRKARINPKEAVLAERERVDEIKKLIDADRYDEALSNLMSDTSADFHYFNKVKAEIQGVEHDAAFARKHGKLFERPPATETPNTCLWSGVNEFGHPLRCHNKCLYHPTETVTDPLGVARPKQLDYCVYHAKFCVNADHHRVPMRIRVENEMALCNECFLLRNGRPPEALLRVPGTRRKRD